LKEDPTVASVEVKVLLVEDDPADAELTEELLSEAMVVVDLEIVQDGVEAMAYLRREGRFAEASRPDVILLDLNMPRKDGREVLQEIRADGELETIPVVVLTTSDADRDVAKSYALGANCYVTKPVGLEQFSDIVRSIEHFWFKVVKLPPNGPR